MRGAPAPPPDAAGDDAVVVVRRQRGGGRARQARPPAWPDRERARRAHPADRRRALPDVVSRSRPEPRAGQFGVRRGGRGARRGGSDRARHRTDRHARRRERARRGRSRARRRRSPIRAPSRRRSATSGGCSNWSTCRLPTGAVAGFAIDIQDLEDARFELAQHLAVAARTGRPHDLGAWRNSTPTAPRPFSTSRSRSWSQIDPEWLGETPEFDRVLERMRDNGRLPEVRDFPAWKNERRDWFLSPEEAFTEDWILTNGDHLRVVAQPLPDGGLAADPRGSHRAGPACLVARHLAARAHRDLRQSVRGDQRVRLRRPPLSVEPPLLRGVGSRRGMARRASPGRRTGPDHGQEAGQSDRRRASPRNGPRYDDRAPVGHRPRVDDRRPPFRIRRRAAARRKCAVHDGRRHRFRPASRRRCASARRGWRRRTRSRPTSSRA